MSKIPTDAQWQDLADRIKAKADASSVPTSTEMTTAIAAETTARQTADAGLQSQIDAISASSDVKDIVGTKAALNAYDTSTLGNNDIIKVLQDESEGGATTYYRWSTTTSTFTLIGEEGPYYTKSEADTLLNAKANTSSLATVATSGSYNDLSNKPTIPAAQVNSDWNASSGVAQILNKPTLATVATSGSYNDLLNKPTIPTATSDLTNDSGFITASDVNTPLVVQLVSPITTTQSVGQSTAQDIQAAYTNGRPIVIDASASRLAPSGTGIDTASYGVFLVEKIAYQGAGSNDYKLYLSAVGATTLRYEATLSTDIYTNNWSCVAQTISAGGVTDVQMDTDSIVSGGVANIPVATSSSYGVAMLEPGVTNADDDDFVATAGAVRDAYHHGAWYATCTTAAGTTAKVGTCSNFSGSGGLTTGAHVTVKFTYANTASAPTLNVNSTGAKAIYVNGSTAATSGAWDAGDVKEFVYDGSHWVMTGGSPNILSGTSAPASTVGSNGDIYVVYTA